MKRHHLIILSAILLILQYISYGQNFSKQVTSYIEIQDSIVGIKNVTIIDGTGNATKTNQDIVFANNKIIAIGKRNKVKIPKEAKIIDGTGKTIIPGLIMLHEHLFHAKPFDGIYKATHMASTFPKMYLAGGVTTMRTAGSTSANSDLIVKNSIENGKTIGPAIDISTPHIERKIPFIKSLYGDESIENWLNYWFDKGITSVKVYNNITKSDLREIIKVAHAKNIKVTGHLCSITYREAAELGIDNLEHSFIPCTDFVADKQEDECALRAGLDSTKYKI